MLREVLSAELRRERPDEVPVLLGRAARWHAARGEAVEAVRIAAQAGDWDFGVHLLAQVDAGVLVPDKAASWSPCWPRSRPSSGRAPPRWPRRWPRPGCGRATRRAPPRTWTARGARWTGWTPRRAPSSGRGSRPCWSCRARTRPGGSRGRPAEQASAAAATVPQYRTAGLLWFAIGCALLRRWEARPAARALARASAQLAAGSLPGLRARALAWQALAAAGCGELAAADRLIGEAAASPAAGQREVACPVALARAQVCVARDEWPPPPRGSTRPTGWPAARPRASRRPPRSPG